MRQSSKVLSCVTAFVGLMLVASSVLAQTGTASIAGSVKDTSGSVLPGVTVEAASPALLEKRSVVTDGAGQYKIVALPLGTYTVTISLTGFSTVKREGIELTANFTAPVDAELKVGSIEETVTVSSQSPVVDVQNTATRSLLLRDALDIIPTNKTLEAFSAMTPGITMADAVGQDVGGSKGETYVQLQIHGTRANDNKTLIDGFETNDWTGRVFTPNPAAAQEVSVELGNGPGEAPANGVYVNYIPKSGANTFSGIFEGNYTGSGMQSQSNLTSNLQSLGLTQSNLPHIVHIWDGSGSLGGPVVKDKLWFFTAERSWGSSGTVVASYYAVNNLSYTYTPDLGRPSVNDFNQNQTTDNLTWQVSPRNKLNFSYDGEYRCDCHRSVSSTLTPDASAIRTYHPKLPAATWTFVATNKLLIEAGAASEWLSYAPNPQPQTPLNTIAVTDSGSGLTYRATPGDTSGSGGYGDKYNYVLNSRLAATYVTGSHSFKVGVQDRYGVKRLQDVGSPYDYTFHNGTPTSITEYAYPLLFQSTMDAMLGVYAQDQWTRKRLTLSGGLRYDLEHADDPAQTLSAGMFTPARTYGAVGCVPCWHSLSPRVSAAYDLFGTGKTAVKASFGKYVEEEMLNTAQANNPLLASNASASRSWNDYNLAADLASDNFVPACDLTNPNANGVLGPNGYTCGAVPSTFGQTIINNTYSPSVLLANRPYELASTVSVQQQLRPGMALAVSYFRTSLYNFTASENTLTSPSEYSPFCVPVPTNVLLPGGGGGNTLCGLYNINPAQFSISSGNALVTQASQFGKETDIYNGVDVTISARMAHGATLQGGMNTGHEVTNTCFTVNSPQQAQFTNSCYVNPPFWHPNFKLSGSIRLPYDFQVSGVFQDLPGLAIAANYTATNAQVQSSLGRPLSGGASTVTVANVIPQQTYLEPRLEQVDIRLIRNFRIAKMRWQGQFDIYNLLNGTAVLTENATLGSSFRVPTAVQDARVFKIGAQLRF